MNWIRENRVAHAGRWVALDGARLIASGDDAKIVFRTARAATDRPFVVHVDPADACPFGGW
jgi:hypothetical protein